MKGLRIGKTWISFPDRSRSNVYNWNSIIIMIIILYFVTYITEYTQDINKKQTKLSKYSIDYKNEHREQQNTILPHSLLMSLYKLKPRYQGAERIVKYIFYTL